MTSLQRFLRRIGIKLAQFTAIQVEVLCSMIIWQDLKIYVVWKPYDVFFLKERFSGDIDGFTGGLAEQPVPGGLVRHLFAIVNSTKCFYPICPEEIQ